MIFVTVGTHKDDFSRLVQSIDDIAKNTRHEVIIQKGSTEYVPKHADHFDFCSYKEIERYHQKADIVVAHAGAGTILTCIKNENTCVIVPRLSKYDEHTDNHQLDLANKASSQNGFFVVSEIKELNSEINRALEYGKEKNTFEAGNFTDKNIRRELNKILNQIEENKRS